jgi:predicted Ser/Thr protein kinase
LSLSPGTRLGSYEIVAAIGAGGMGEVYKARDVRLNRDVAIKVLPDIVAGDPQRVARFEREAQLLASLNHPHIAQIYGVEEQGGMRALVMELIEGRTLAELIAAAGLSSGDALAIARQMTEALEAAHEKGIIHRDLKPGNVMVTPDGAVKVLDFGLGKALETDAARDVSKSPTMTLGATQMGMILGTAAYMPPEQAKGRAADRRSDVWAFGCVLYEMLTRRRAFEGDDVSETLATVIKGEPDWNALPADLPPAIRILIQRCLVKDRAHRIADISTVRFVLSEPAALGSTQIGAAVAPVTTSRGIRPIVAVALVLAAVAVTAVALWLLRPDVSGAGTGAVAHLSVMLPSGDEIGDPDDPPLAVSPDGTHLVYVGIRGGKSQLYDRAIDRPDPRAIAGTVSAAEPFFSPDGRWVGFFADGKLKKVSLDGGALEVLAPATSPRGGAWSMDGNIYYAPTNISNIWKVPANGGAPTEVTKQDRSRGEVSHRFPQVANKTLFFTVWTGPGTDEKAFAAQPLSATEHRVLVRGAEMGRFVPPAYLVYAHADDLVVLPINLASLEVASIPPVPLSERVHSESTEGGAYAVSDNGVIAYVRGGDRRLARRLVWVDPIGKVTPLPLPERAYQQVAISPDGSKAAVQVSEGVVGLWLYDFGRST